ncbi:6703_t:CDS:2 [Cetraspora pellucida]|uniref:Phospho-2-dehydro-3-deoxyheptonate aldolase n=2 Tax=Cetraspora pellucida TaxID=1433469 RepID=A0A9N9GXS7_9GLOM|nr:6703_t:CDS:2 [Cetraspora pellucida]
MSVEQVTIENSNHHASDGTWTPSTWRTKKINQNVTYEDKESLQKVVEKLNHVPPLVTPTEINKLRHQLEQVALNKAFLLQGGDCAELFDYCSQEPIESKLKVLLQMSLVLIWGSRIPVIRIARMCGQYAKPRSNEMEMYEGKEIHSFRGDIINGYEPTDRQPDPDRLLKGTRQEYQTIVDRLTDTLDFMKTIGADSPFTNTLNSIDLFMSHEGLILEYEQCMTRLLKDPETGSQKWYNVGAHFLWVGDRTRQLDEAHIEYFRGIRNPIGVKVGPTMQPEELKKLLNIVNPDKEIGRELSKVIHTHKNNASKLNGVHFELTGEGVTECIGGSMELSQVDLEQNYKTYCDPRLNYEQSLDVAFLIAKYCEKERNESLPAL